MTESLIFVPCLMCDGHIFVADEEYGIVWSHLEDTGCDDPVPVSLEGERHIVDFLESNS